ncbi:hypothetical protein C9374_001045 [Naegleria lovaniensis]|uniref:Guanine nucleotide-binding protein subunit beta-like protein n=1 Tax=Naegleria lovaniensis TaxID=51637 RepID=A0AA88KLS3_NAELO|nr:uncharacterized protein C9374_001045 [Naegleria lovaniensis]KAG2388195.1 hypothetical protein C9374_001045 [Naegleria lovaniensis]
MMINSPSKINSTANNSIWGNLVSSSSPRHQQGLSSPLLMPQGRMDDSHQSSNTVGNIRNTPEQHDRSNLIDRSQSNGTIGDLIKDIDQEEDPTSNSGHEIFYTAQNNGTVGHQYSPQQESETDFFIRSPLKGRKSGASLNGGNSNQGTPTMVNLASSQQQQHMLMMSPPQSSNLLNSPNLNAHNWVNEKIFLENKIAKLTSELYQYQCEVQRLNRILDEYRRKENAKSGGSHSTSTVGNSPSPTEMNGLVTGGNGGVERPLSPSSTCTTSSWSAVGTGGSAVGFNDGINSQPFMGSSYVGENGSSISQYSLMTNPAQQLLISPRKSPTPANVTNTPGRYNRSNSFGSNGSDAPNTNLMQTNRLSVLATPNRGMNNNPSNMDTLFPSTLNQDLTMSPNRMMPMNGMPIGMESPISTTPLSSGSNPRKYNNNNGVVGPTSPFTTPSITNNNGRMMFTTPVTTPSPNNLYFNSSIAITPKSAASSVSSSSASTASSTPTLSDLSNGAAMQQVKSQSPKLPNASGTSQVIHRNGTGNEIVYLLSGGGVGSIKVYDLSREEFTQAQDNQQQHAKRGFDKHALTDYYLSLKGHSRFVSALHSHNGKICSGSGDNSIRTWDFNTGECEHVLAGCEGKVGALCSFYGTLISGSKDGNSHRIRAWDIEKATCVKCIPAHNDWINVLCASDTTLFSGSGDKKVKVWSGPNFENTLTLENQSFVLSLVYDPTYNTLVAGTYDGYIRIWDIRSGSKFVKQIKAHTNGVLSLCYHKGMLCSGSKDQTISIYDPKTWNRESQLIGHTDAVKCLVSYQNQWLCSGSYDRTVKLWNLETATRGSYCTIATGFKNYTLTCHTA